MLVAAANKTKTADPENFDANKFIEYVTLAGDDAVEAFQRILGEAPNWPDREPT